MRKWSISAVLAAVLLSSAVPVQASGGERHWVEEEEAGFTQFVIPARDTASAQGPVTQEEWESFQAKVLNEENLDKPISISHWATLLKLAVRLPQDRMDFLLDGYAYRFDDQGRIKREDAVGGLVKLLSAETLNATWSQGEADPSETIKDTKEVSEMQRGLFYIAYREGILDAQVIDTFRPQDLLTNAEAVSMAYRVMDKYGAPVGYDVLWPSSHWSAAEMKAFLHEDYGQPESLKMTKRLMQLTLPEAGRMDDPISPEAWHQLLVHLGKLPEVISAEDARRYTTDLAEDGRIERSVAVVGLMKLYGPMRDATQEELAAVKIKFKDAGAAFDISKLAIASGLGFVRGEGEGYFRPQQALTVAEAYVLAARISAYKSYMSTGVIE